MIAHRGSSATAPENTIAAFREAVDLGADGIEFDVRLAKDGVPVVIHDATLERTGGKAVAVAELSSEELGKIDVGGWFGSPAVDFEPVPTLAAVLEFLRDFDGIVYIELKCRDDEIAALSRAVCDVIGSSPLLPRIIVKSFKLGIIPYFKMSCPNVATAALFAPKVMRYLRKEKYLVKIAEEFRADMLSLHYSLASRKLMKRVEKTELPVTIWTADSPRLMKRAISLGLSAVITNDPARQLALRRALLEAL